MILLLYVYCLHLLNKDKNSNSLHAAALKSGFLYKQLYTKRLNVEPFKYSFGLQGEYLAVLVMHWCIIKHLITWWVKKTTYYLLCSYGWTGLSRMIVIRVSLSDIRWDCSHLKARPGWTSKQAHRCGHQFLLMSSGSLAGAIDRSPLHTVSLHNSSF